MEIPMGNGTDASIVKEAHTMSRRIFRADPITFDYFDKVVIISIIAVFFTLFVWLIRSDFKPQTYAFWTFTALLTLIFVGFLRATGVFHTGWGALGGSVAVYAGLLWMTQGTFERQYDLTKENKSLRDEITSLRSTLQVDPAKYTLQLFYEHLQKKNFQGAWDLISDARKSERMRDRADAYDAYVKTFENTQAYRNLTFDLVREESNGQRIYRVTHDVLDNVPHSTLFENRAKQFSSLSGSVDRDSVVRIVKDNLREYYVIPDPAVPVIETYIRTRTVNELLDPTLIGEAVIHLKNDGIELRRSPTPPVNASVWRYFRYDNVVMIKQGDAWKIRVLNDPVIAVYP
jgi:IS1 family transposase